MKEQQASEKVPLLKLQASQPTHKALSSTLKKEGKQIWLAGCERVL
jgi:hypothetical protein